MRPTPTQTVEGVTRILRDTVAPAVTDQHAAAQLRQAIAVLSQLDAEDATVHLQRADAALEELLAALRPWAAQTPARGPLLDALSPPPGGDGEHSSGDGTYAATLAAHLHHRAALASFVAALAAWRQQHGPADSQELVVRIGHHLATDPRRGQR